MTRAWLATCPVLSVSIRCVCCWFKRVVCTLAYSNSHLFSQNPFTCSSSLFTCSPFITCRDFSILELQLYNLSPLPAKPHSLGSSSIVPYHYLSFIVLIWIDFPTCQFQMSVHGPRSAGLALCLSKHPSLGLHRLGTDCCFGAGSKTEEKDAEVRCSNSNWSISYKQTKLLQEALDPVSNTLYFNWQLKGPIFVLNNCLDINKSSTEQVICFKSHGVLWLTRIPELSPITRLLKVPYSTQIFLFYPRLQWDSLPWFANQNL